MVVGHHHVTACSFSKGVIVSILSSDIGLYRTAFQCSSVLTQWFCFANWVGAPRMNDATRMRFNAAATISGTALPRDYIQSRAFIRIECERGEKESDRGMSHLIIIINKIIIWPLGSAPAFHSSYGSGPSSTAKMNCSFQEGREYEGARSEE